MQKSSANDLSRKWKNTVRPKYPRPALVMCIAASEDAAWLAQWERHLLPLQQAGHLRIWSEHLLLAGEERYQQMNHHVDQANIVILLLSSDFCASEECMALAERAMLRLQQEQVTLVPLLLRASAWEASPLGSLSCLPSLDRPVTSWNNTDEAFQACLEGLRQHLGLPIREISKKCQLSFFPTQRLQVIRALQQEYRRRLDHSLQGRVAIELGLHERTDIVASSAQLVFHDTETERSLPVGTTIIQVYDTIQRGLLILGAPGAGKTTLLLTLVLELLQRAESDTELPLPIILSLSSWAITRLALADWLREQLHLVYGIARKVGKCWIKQDQILFLLDGLDEMDPSDRSICIAAINHHRGEHSVPLIVSSRSWEYERQQARLILPTAIEIQPLEQGEVMTYLTQAGEAFAKARTALQTNTALQQIVTTPLILMIILLTYRGQEANELLQAELPADQQQLIFRHYIQRMLKRHLHRRTISTRRLLHSLQWLARAMQDRHQTEFYLEQLQPEWFETKQERIAYHLLYGVFIGLSTGLPVGLVAGLIAESIVRVPVGVLTGLPVGLIVGQIAGIAIGLRFRPLRGLLLGLCCALLAGLIFVPLVLPGVGDQSISLMVEVVDYLFRGPFYGLSIGLFSGLASGLFIASSENKLTEKIVWSWKKSVRGVCFGLIAALILGLFSGIFEEVFGLPGFVTTLDAGLATAVSTGLLLVPIFGLLGGISGTSLNTDFLCRPNQGVHTSGWVALRCGVVFLLAFGFIAGLISRLLQGGMLTDLTVGGTTGLLLGVFGGLCGGGMKYLQHYILRFLLWQRGHFPWLVVPLLEEAIDCILLQRVGGGYRFIHPLLQEHIASLDMEAILEQSEGQTLCYSEANEHPSASGILTTNKCRPEEV